MIQTLCYVTIQEATRLLPGCWHKEADESWILPEEQVSFQGVRDPEVSKNGASSLARDMQSFLQLHGGTAPLKITRQGLLWVCSLHPVPRWSLLSASQALS